MIPFPVGLFGGPARPAIMAQAKIITFGLGGSFGGYPLSSFDSFQADLDAGVYGTDFTLAMYMVYDNGYSSIADGSRSTGGANQPSPDPNTYIFDNNDGSIFSVTGFGTDPCFAFVSAAGDMRTNGGPQTLVNPLSPYAAGTYTATGATTFMIFWPFSLTAAEMDEVHSLYSP